MKIHFSSSRGKIKSNFSSRISRDRDSCQGLGATGIFDAFFSQGKSKWVMIGELGKINPKICHKWTKSGPIDDVHQRLRTRGQPSPPSVWVRAATVDPLSSLRSAPIAQVFYQLRSSPSDANQV